MGVNGTEHVEVKEAVVHRSYQDVRCRMGKAARIAIRARRVDDDEINIPVERVDRIDEPLAFKLSLSAICIARPCSMQKWTGTSRSSPVWAAHARRLFM